MEYTLVANCRMPLLHMSKPTFEWKKQINVSMSFLLDICWIQVYTRTKLLKIHWKHVSKTHLIKIPILILIQYHRKKNTRVLALVVFYELGNINPGKIFKVLSCVIYTIIDRYVCIDYLGTEKKKICELRLGCTLQSKHEGMDYANLFGIGITDILLNMM